MSDTLEPVPKILRVIFTNTAGPGTGTTAVECIRDIITCLSKEGTMHGDLKRAFLYGPKLPSIFASSDVFIAFLLFPTLSDLLPLDVKTRIETLLPQHVKTQIEKQLLFTASNHRQHSIAVQVEDMPPTSKLLRFISEEALYGSDYGEYTPVMWDYVLPLPPADQRDVSCVLTERVQPVEATKQEQPTTEDYDDDDPRSLRKKTPSDPVPKKPNPTSYLDTDFPPRIGDSSRAFGPAGFGDSSRAFGPSGFGDSSRAFGPAGFGDSSTAFGPAGFGDSSRAFGPAGFGDSSRAFGPAGFGDSSTAFGPAGFGDSSTAFGSSGFNSRGFGGGLF
jgi:hypothetical protein